MLKSRLERSQLVCQTHHNDSAGVFCILLSELHNPLAKSLHSGSNTNLSIPSALAKKSHKQVHIPCQKKHFFLFYRKYLIFVHCVFLFVQGEVEIDEDESLTTLEAKIEPVEDRKASAGAAEADAANVVLEDTTEQHNSHLFDLNCKICTGKQAPPGEHKPTPHV